MEKYLSYFVYGQPVSIKIDGNRHHCVMQMSESNFSFLEFIGVKNTKVISFLFLYHVRDIGLELKSKAVIVRMRNYKETFKIFFKDEEELKLGLKNLRLITKKLKDVPFCEFSIKNMIRYSMYFSGVAKFGEQYTLTDIESLLYALRINLENDDQKRLIRKSVLDMDEIKTFDFRRIFKVLLLKEELADYFKEILGLEEEDKIGKKKASLGDLKEWLEKKQHQDYTILELKTFFTQINMSNPFKKPTEDITEINFENFCMYIFSSENNLWDRNKTMVYQDTTKPLNHYYINSSHNTYLIGHQLYGTPDFEGYKRALENGVRCVEIDCWDGSGNSPVVTHGKTFCSNLKFKDLIEHLAKIAFMYTDYPLIISLEMHCSKAQRDVIAKVLIDNFNDQLFVLSKQNFENQELPSLEFLKNKVLIKCKSKYPAYIMRDEETSKQEQQELLHQITSLYGEKYNDGGLKTVWGISSLKEGRVIFFSEKVLDSNALIEFNKKHLSRVYPDGKRVDSTNFDPTKSWNQGCHCIALNIQKSDVFTLLNQMKFRENGGSASGYLLKPEILIKGSFDFQRDAITKMVYIKVLSSQIIESNLYNDSDYVYPFVEVEVMGMDKDVLCNKGLITKISQNNLLHSIYNENDNKALKLQFYYPELAFIRFSIRDAKNNNLLKQAIISVDCLTKGIRSLELFDTNNVFDSFSFLLLEIDF